MHDWILGWTAAYNAQLTQTLIALQGVLAEPPAPTTTLMPGVLNAASTGGAEDPLKQAQELRKKAKDLLTQATKLRDEANKARLASMGLRSVSIVTGAGALSLVCTALLQGGGNMPNNVSARFLAATSGALGMTAGGLSLLAMAMSYEADRLEQQASEFNSQAAMLEQAAMVKSATIGL
jgi:hypothetical protein